MYLLAVIVAGAGEDIFHPAPWAWIAADETPASWLLTTVLVAVGTAAYLIVPRRATGAEAHD